MPNQKIFYQLLIFVALYQHAKNYTISSICSGEMVGLKILKSDWQRPFWPVQKQVFPKYRICARTQQIIFIIEQIQRKLLTRFLFRLKKPYFWPISPIFGAKKKFF